MSTTLTWKQRYDRRLAALKQERSSYDPLFRELSEYIQPRKSRFYVGEAANAGEKKHGKIVNGTATLSRRILAAGMMAGLTSKARPWYRLTTPDPRLAKVDSVKSWLYAVENEIRQAMARSNLYEALHLAYEDLGTPGTAALYVEEDVEDLVRGYCFPVGSYYLANSARLRVDTCYRELQMTVAQIIEQFYTDPATGRVNLSKCSQRIREAYEDCRYEERHDVVHAIEPRRNREYGRGDARNMPWKSCWYEPKGDEGLGPLRESGYHEFPVMAPRWSITGEDVYGSSPGMDALGDVKGLQVLEKRKAQVVDKIVTPPMRAPAELANQQVSLTPGAVTYVGSVHPGQTFAPAFEIKADAVQVVEMSIREHEQRIGRYYYADLWLALTHSDGQMTAKEVAVRHEEKFIQLGPVLERLQDELLDPLIDRVFGILLRNGYLPPPPEELQGVQLRVEYISILAQAQKMIGTAGVERLTGYVNSFVETKPDAIDKLNEEKAIDAYGDMLGTPPDLLRSAEEVAAIRQARARAQQQAAALEQANAVAQGAKTLSETDTEGDNALTRMVGALSPLAGSEP